MAITYVGGQVGAAAGSSSFTQVTFSLTNGLASTPSSGDLVVAAFASGATVNASGILRIDDFTGLSYNYTQFGSHLYADDTFDTNLWVGYRFMTGAGSADSGVSFPSWTGANTDAGAYTIHVYRGVDAVVTDVAVQTATGTNTRLANPPQITPVTAGAIIHVVGAAAMGTGGTFTAAYLTDLRVTTRVDTNDVNIASGYVTWTSGAYDPAAFGGGGTDTTNDSWAAMTIALRPAAVAAVVIPRLVMARGGVPAYRPR